MGISTNSAELDLVAACRGMGVPTAILVDFFAGHRLEGRDPGTGFPDVLMYTNEAAAEDMRARYRLPAQRLAFVGSTYLESLVLDDSPAECSPPEVYAKLELDAASCRVLPFFVSPDGARQMPSFEPRLRQVIGMMRIQNNVLRVLLVMILCTIVSIPGCISRKRLNVAHI